MPPSTASYPGNDIFLFFFVIYLHFSYENWSLGCPPGWMPGAVAPFAPPLHAAAERTLLVGGEDNEQDC